MSPIEIQLVKILWFHLFGTFKDVNLKEHYGSANYRLLSRHYLGGDISDKDRRHLASLGWRHRKLLPAELAVACALKGGSRI